MNEEILERGRVAQAIANNAEFKQLIENIKMDMFYQFSMIEALDAEKKEEVHLTMRGLNLIVKKINSYMDNAKYEKAVKTTQSDV